MNIKDTVIKPQQFADALSKALGKKQAKTVELILLEAQAEITARRTIEWGEDGCPHSLLDGCSLQFKHECPGCWLELKKDLGV